MSCAQPAKLETDAKRAASDYGQCPNLEHAECGDHNSGLFCNTITKLCECDPATGLCESDDLTNEQTSSTIMQVQAQPMRPGLSGRTLHDIAKTQHLSAGQTLQTPVEQLQPKQHHLNTVGQIQLDHTPGSASWRANMMVAYRHLLRSEHALPLLDQEHVALAELEARLPNSTLDELRSMATGMADKYTRLLAQDDRLAPLQNFFSTSKAEARELEECVPHFRQSDHWVNLDQRVEGCVSLYLGLANTLRQLNDRALVEPKRIDHIESVALYAYQRAAGGTSADTLVEKEEETLFFVHLRDLPIAALSVYRTLIDPELSAQGMHAHLRLPLHVEQQGNFWGNLSNKKRPLGQWAQIAIGGSDFADRAETERLEWFRSAFEQAVGELKDNNEANASMLTAAEVTEPNALAMAMEYSGLMQLYGGYDTTGNPRGFQAFHDSLMEDVKAEENWGAGLSIGTAIACAGLVIATAANPVATGLCTIATGALGGYQAHRLHVLATTAETLTYVGLEYGLVPSTESSRLRRLSNIAIGTVIVFDVIFGTIEIVQTLPEIVAMMKTRGWLDEGTTLRAIQDAASAGVHRLRQAWGADVVQVFHFDFDNLKVIGTDLGLDADYPRHQFARTSSPTINFASAHGSPDRRQLLVNLGKHPETSRLLEMLQDRGLPQIGYIPEEHWSSQFAAIFHRASLDGDTPPYILIGDIGTKDSALFGLLPHELWHHLAELMHLEGSFLTTSELEYLSELASQRGVALETLQKDYIRIAEEVSAYRLSLVNAPTEELAVLSIAVGDDTVEIVAIELHALLGDAMADNNPGIIFDYLMQNEYRFNHPEIWNDIDLAEVLKPEFWMDPNSPSFYRGFSSEIE